MFQNVGFVVFQTLSTFFYVVACVWLQWDFSQTLHRVSSASFNNVICLWLKSNVCFNSLLPTLWTPSSVFYIWRTHLLCVKEQSWPLRPWCPFSLRLTLMSRNLVQQEIRIWAGGEVVYWESVVNVYLLYTCTTITARMYGPTGD